MPRPVKKRASIPPAERGPQLVSVRRTHPEWLTKPPRFPFTVPTIANLDTLDLDASVVCFVGENGSGKSTLLEGIAIACGLPSVGAVDRIADDPSLEEQQWLARALKLAWRSRSYRGFFLRAEAFFGFQQRLTDTRREFEADLARLEQEYAHRSAEAKVLATGPARTSLMEFEARYGANPDARSHGEAFLNFFQKRLVPNGLFLMDEPEAALSPQRQLALLAMMFEAVAEGAQFIIATHSPLILAYPGARIYSFDDAQIEPVAWDQTEHVRLTRDFLTDPERYLRQLRESD